MKPLIAFATHWLPAPMFVTARTRPAWRWKDQYLIKPSDVAPLVPQLKTRLTFFGHTHVQGGFAVTPDGVTTIDPERG